MPGGQLPGRADRDEARRHAHLRLHGLEPQVELGINCCYWATWGAMFAPIFPLLAWDVTWNEGVTRPIGLVAPEGTVVNCLRPAPISIATVGTVQIVNNLSTIVLSKMFGASDALPRSGDGRVARQPRARRDARARRARGSSSSRRSRTRSAAPAAHARCGTASTSAGRSRTSSRDGRTSRARSSDTPLRYLYRRAVPDSGGPGKHRGGVCHEYAFTPSGGRGPMGLVLFGKGTRAPMSLGLFGGYPGCNVGYSTFRSANVDELPGRLDEIARRARGRTSSGATSSSSRATSSTSASWAAAATATRSTATRRSSSATSPAASSRWRPRARSTASCWTATRRRQPTTSRRLEIRAASGSAVRRSARADGDQRDGPADLRVPAAARATARHSARGAATDGRPRRSGLEGARASCAGSRVERAGPHRARPRRVLPDRGLLSRLRRRFSTPTSSSATTPRCTTASSTGPDERPRGRRRPSFNLATHFLDRNLDEGRGERVALYCGEAEVTYAELCAPDEPGRPRAARPRGRARRPRAARAVGLPTSSSRCWYGALKIGAVVAEVYTFLPAKDYRYYAELHTGAGRRRRRDHAARPMREAIASLRRPADACSSSAQAELRPERDRASTAATRPASDHLEPAPTSRDDDRRLEVHHRQHRRRRRRPCTVRTIRWSRFE